MRDFDGYFKRCQPAHLGARPMKKAIAFVLFTVSAFGVPASWGQDATSRGRSDAPLPPTSVHGSEADNVWTNNNRFKGPIPWADASAFGRMIPRSGISTNTANISLAAPTNVRLTNPGFVNGDGITIWGAGASITMSTPGAPTITPSIAAGGTSTGIVKTSASGSSTYKYRIIARDKFGGLTPAGSVGTTAD